MTTTLGQKLKQFHETFGVEREVNLYNEISAMTAGRLNSYLKQLEEEMRELHQAASVFVDIRGKQDTTAFAKVMKQLKDGEAVNMELLDFKCDQTEEARVQMLDAITDIIYVAANIADKLGFDIDTALERVHESNMAKLAREEDREDENGVQYKTLVSDPKGKPFLWEANNPYGQPAGKVRKPDDWTPPKLDDLI